MDNLHREKLPHLYDEVFNKSPAGIVILDDLYSRYMDAPAKHPLDALALAYQAGQRDVVHFIMLQRDRLARMNQQEENDHE